MWNYNKDVRYVYAHVNTMHAFAVIDGLTGWKRIAPVSPDGVTNVLDILKVAKANNRKVNVYVSSADDQIQAAYFA
jgi:hypothetical protein